MSDYATPTVVIPPIPEACMTPVERFILTSVFAHECIPETHAIYLFAETGINEEVFVSQAACDRLIRTGQRMPERFRVVDGDAPAPFLASRQDPRQSPSG